MTALDLTASSRLLIVDDNPAIHEDIRKILAVRNEVSASFLQAKSELFGPGTPPRVPRVQFEIQSAYQGQDAVRMAEEARRAGNPFALAFVDVRMPPGLDGVETIGLLWKSCPDLQVVIVTAYSDYSWDAIFDRLGRLENLVILKKPFDNIEVLQLASALTEKWHLARAMERHLEELDGIVESRTEELRAANEQLRLEMEERLRAEEAARGAEVRFLQAQKMESLGRMAGGIAHDMNNVLGAILSLASANLEMESPGDRAHRSFEIIVKAAERGTKAVKSLLGFARQSPVEDLPVDLNGILREELHILERTTLARLQFRLDLEPDLQAMRGDANALAQAFMNLCINAVDAMPGNGVLTLTTRNLDGGRIEAVVEDTGCGMTAETLRRATDPFFTTKKVGEGTGLGLAMVYSTVAAHDGEMEIESAPGEGTRIHLRFPACGTQALDDLATAGEPGILSSRALDVMLVDDDEVVQEALQDVLGFLGHRVAQMLSGEAALARIEAGAVPDVVILDMNMPGLGGARTLAALRALRPDLPVLLATGRTDQVALDLVETFPLVSLMPKPFGIDELRRNLSALAGI
jgi:signal transduction histidine kinase